LAEVRISGARIMSVTAIGKQRRLMVPSKGVSVIIEQRINCCRRRDNRLNPAIVGWEIPEKEGRKASSGLLWFDEAFADGVSILRKQQNGLPSKDT
jgi:hypothetical protein